PLIAGPLLLRSSGVIAPSVFKSAETDPFLPRAAIRADSSAASSLAEAIVARISFSSCAMSVMARLPLPSHGRAFAGHPRLEQGRRGCPTQAPGTTQSGYAGSAALAFSTIA